LIGDSWCKIHKIKQIILSKKNILKNHFSLSIATIFSTICVIFLMTGALYFRNEITIYDNGKVLRAYTMEDTAEGILKEQKIELSGLDYYIFDGFNDSRGELRIMRAVDVTVTDGKTKIPVKIRRLDSAENAAEAAGLDLGEYDSANFSLDYQCTGGENIVINRAFDVKVFYDGKTKTLKASNNTVKALLQREGIDFSPTDVVTPSIDTQVYKDMEITINRVEYRKNSSVEIVPFKTIEKASNLQVLGHKQVISKGSDGKARVISKEKYVDGKLISREILETTQLIKPKDEIVALGKALATPYSKREFNEIILENGIPKNYKYKLSGKSCAYTARSGSGTASGRELQIGTVAVDPKIIPYGSLLYIVTQDGRSVYGAAVAADTGYFIYTDVLVDLYMGTTAEHYDDACDWGARFVDIYVINTGKY
jgi:uncharacterized protein YabE (DUF348 family)/3D (Asp-Asp-Asp) domain-containing protein